MPPHQVQLLSFRTCSNEALHFQLKVCQEQITQQRIQAFPPQLAAFSLAKMLAHHSAAYSPTLAQRKEAEILSLMQGTLATGFLPPLEVGLVQPILSRQDLRKPVHSLDAQKVAARKARKAQQAKQWTQEVQNRKLERQRRDGPKRSLKRAVFTQKKSLTCDWKRCEVGFTWTCDTQAFQPTHVNRK